MEVKIEIPENAGIKKTIETLPEAFLNGYVELFRHSRTATNVDTVAKDITRQLQVMITRYLQGLGLNVGRNGQTFDLNVRDLTKDSKTVSHYVYAFSSIQNSTFSILPLFTVQYSIASKNLLYVVEGDNWVKPVTKKYLYNYDLLKGVVGVKAEGYKESAEALYNELMISITVPRVLMRE